MSGVSTAAAFCTASNRVSGTPAQLTFVICARGPSTMVTGSTPVSPSISSGPAVIWALRITLLVVQGAELAFEHGAVEPRFDFNPGRGHLRLERLGVDALVAGETDFPSRH